MAKHDVKLMQIFKRYLNKPGDEVVIAGSAASVGPLMKQKVVLRAQYHDEDAESAPYRIDKAIEWAERNQCVVLERKRRIMNDGSESAELVVDVAAIANAARNAVIEKKLPPRGAGVYIEQQGGSFAVGPTNDGWSVANYGGEGVNFAHGFKTASEAKSWCASKGYKVEDVVLANAARSRNAVVQKALNAVARNGAMAALDSSEKSKIKSIASGMPCSFMDGGDSLSGVIKHSKRPFLYIDFDVSKSEIGGKPYYEWYVHAWNRTRKWERNGGQYKIEDAVSAAAQAMRGAKQMIEKWSGGIPLNADTSVLRETAVNGKFKVGDRVIGELRTPSSVGTVVRVEKFRLMKVKFDEDGTIFTVDQNKFVPYTNSSRTANAVVAKALNARRVAKNADYVWSVGQSKMVFPEGMTQKVKGKILRIRDAAYGDTKYLYVEYTDPRDGTKYSGWFNDQTDRPAHAREMNEGRFI